MKKYAILDLDDTLLDFKRGETVGIQRILQENGVSDLTAGLQTYLQINHDVWTQIEHGAAREPLLATRFTRTFAALGYHVDGQRLEQQYSQMLDQNFYTLAGATDFLADLNRQGLTVVAGTNGTKSIQLNRLAGAQLTAYFDRIFISEDIGFDKADARFFTPIRQYYPDMTATNTLMIGDRLQSDILGAQNAGLDSVWFNPTHANNSTTLHPTYEAASYAQITQLLLA